MIENFILKTILGFEQFAMMDLPINPNLWRGNYSRNGIINGSMMYGVIFSKTRLEIYLNTTP
jgi:hypothetical protein